MKARRKIYPSFEALVKENKHALKLYGKSRFRSVLRMIWNVRQLEIDQHQEKINSLNNTIKSLRIEISKLHYRHSNKSKEVENIRKYSEVVERAISMGRYQLDKLTAEQEDLLQQLRSAYSAVLNLDDKNESLQKEISVERETHEKTLTQLEESNALIRSQRRLNSDMERELSKLGGELRKLERTGLA